MEKTKKFTKEEMKVGKRYKGYGYINEYKQFCFEPEATGSQAGREKMLMTKGDVTIKRTKNYLIVNMKTPLKYDEPTLAKDLMSKFNIVFDFLKNYEI